MIKKISYILTLIATIFITNVIVKAEVTCTYNLSGGDVILYKFTDAGEPISKIARFDAVTEYSEKSQKIIVRNGTQPECPKSYTDFIDSAYDADGKVVLLINNYTVTANGCSELTDYTSCVSDTKFSCIWIDRKTGKIINNGNVTYKDAYCNFDNLQYVRCGNAFDIPTYLPKMISFVINLLKIVTPIILIFTSAISLLKAITASKEDEMNKAKDILLRRIIIAALIFFTITITEFVINKVADGDEPEELSSCFNCFINNSCDSNIYYKNNINGEYICRYASDSSLFSEEDQQKYCH